jgi:hypothetical protein
MQNRKRLPKAREPASFDVIYAIKYFAMIESLALTHTTSHKLIHPHPKKPAESLDPPSAGTPTRDEGREQPGCG